MHDRRTLKIESFNHILLKCPANPFFPSLSSNLDPFSTSTSFAGSFPVNIPPAKGDQPAKRILLARSTGKRSFSASRQRALYCPAIRVVMFSESEKVRGGWITLVDLGETVRVLGADL